jgi:hypothetical protein
VVNLAGAEKAPPAGADGAVPFGDRVDREADHKGEAHPRPSLALPCDELMKQNSLLRAGWQVACSRRKPPDALAKNGGSETGRHL